MKYFKYLAILLTLLVLAAIIINTLPSAEDDQREDISQDNCSYDSAKILVSVNWTGSVSQIPNYRVLLRGAIKDSLLRMINGLGEHQNIDLSYVFFGLHRQHPDFLDNYIKFFQADTTNSFANNDWQNLISNLTGNNIGYHTALTVSRQMSVIKAFQSVTQHWDNYYLIWVTDNFYGVTNGNDITNELNELSGWSQNVANRNERIANIGSAESLVQRFNRDFEFVSKRDVTINSTNPNKKLYEILYKIQPRPKYFANNFIKFPEKIEFRYLSKNKISVPLPITFLEKNIRKNGHLIEEIVISIIDENNACRAQFSFSPLSMPSNLELDGFTNIAKIKTKVRYRYLNGENIFQSFRETHEFEILCHHTEKGRLLGIWPVRPKLLNIGGALKIFNGEVIIANFFNMLFFIAVGAWVLHFMFPRIIPPAPKVKIELIKG